MSSDMILLIAAAIAFLLAMSIGANDVANSMGTAVGSKAITIKQALIIAGILEFGGAYFFGKNVTETIKSGIFKAELITDHRMFIAGAFAALLAAAIWVLAATLFSMPVSTSHSIVGAMAGFAIVAFGWGSVNWFKIGLIVISWILSPLIGGLVAFLIFKAISRLIFHKTSPFAAAKRVAPVLVGITVFSVCILFLTCVVKSISVTPIVYVSVSVAAGALALGLTHILIKKMPVSPDDEFLSVEHIFKRMQVFMSCYISFAHGANDVANAIGPLAAIYAIVKMGSLEGKTQIPVSLMVLGGLGISLGIFLLGSKVMKTIGESITELNNTRGFTINFGTATTVLIASSLGFPVSTTHTLVGSVVGVGYARGIEAVNLGVLRQIIISWIITVPVAALTAAGLYLLFVQVV